MTQTTMIHVFPRPPSLLRRLAEGVVVWGFPVAAEGFSRWLFGGSWVIDLMVLVALCGIIARMGSRSSGAAVEMSREEIRRWVSAGMPADIASWRRFEQAKSIRGQVIE